MKTVIDVLKFVVQIIPFLISFFEKKESRRERKEYEDTIRRIKDERPKTMGDITLD